MCDELAVVRGLLIDVRCQGTVQFEIAAQFRIQKFFSNIELDVMRIVYFGSLVMVVVGLATKQDPNIYFNYNNRFSV